MRHRPPLRQRRQQVSSVSVEDKAPTIARVRFFNQQAGRRVYADEVEKSPQYRDHAAVAGQLSITYSLEFMLICRDVLPPNTVQNYDKEKAFPPAFRSMKELINNKRHLNLLSKAVDIFAKNHPDYYRFTLESLYGTQVVIVVPDP